MGPAGGHLGPLPHPCGDPGSTPIPLLPRMDLLEEIIAELRGGCPLGDKPSFDPAPEIDS